MPLTDPSDLELNTLRELVDFAGLRVLEIGAGDGRLAWPLAVEAARWIALDPDAGEIALAASDLREKQIASLRLSLGDGRALSFPDDYFDIAFFTWSLC